MLGDFDFRGFSIRSITVIEKRQRTQAGHGQDGTDLHHRFIVTLSP
jgi:hypothetical protein